MMRFLIFFSISVLIYAWPNHSLGCFAPPTEASVSDEVLVRRTKKIYYIETIKKHQLGNFEFKVIENLRTNNKKSSAQDKIKKSLKSSAKPDSGLSNIFIHGADQSDDIFNRVFIRPDCELVPSFEMGKRYLGFLDKPYSFKSFEIVNSVSDDWYLKVKKLIAEGN